MRRLLQILEAKADAPNYRKAEEGATARCGTCRHFSGGRCTKFNFKASAVMVCDSWSGRKTTGYHPPHFYAVLSQGSGSKQPMNGNGGSNGGTTNGGTMNGGGMAGGD